MVGALPGPPLHGRSGQEPHLLEVTGRTSGQDLRQTGGRYQRATAHFWGWQTVGATCGMTKTQVSPWTPLEGAGQVRVLQSIGAVAHLAVRG
jgi:hypothetical protein